VQEVIAIHFVQLLCLPKNVYQMLIFEHISNNLKKNCFCKSYGYIISFIVNFNLEELKGHCLVVYFEAHNLMATHTFVTVCHLISKMSLKPNSILSIQLQMEFNVIK